MWAEFRNKIIAGVAAILVPGAFYTIDKIGWTPVTQNQLRLEGFYQKRDRLLDRVEDKTITEFQRGVLYGLCAAMGIKSSECEKRDQ